MRRCTYKGERKGEMTGETEGRASEDAIFWNPDSAGRSFFDAVLPRLTRRDAHVTRHLQTLTRPLTRQFKCAYGPTFDSQIKFYGYFVILFVIETPATYRSYNQ
jgi:hypothetical protein